MSTKADGYAAGKTVHDIGGAVGVSGEGSGRGGSKHGKPHYSVEAGDHAPKGKTAPQHDGWEINGRISGPSHGLGSYEHAGYTHTSKHR